MSYEVPNTPIYITFNNYPYPPGKNIHPPTGGHCTLSLKRKKKFAIQVIVNKKIFLLNTTVAKCGNSLYIASNRNHLHGECKIGKMYYIYENDINVIDTWRQFLLKVKGGIPFVISYFSTT